MECIDLRLVYCLLLNSTQWVMLLSSIIRNCLVRASILQKLEKQKRQLDLANFRQFQPALVSLRWEKLLGWNINQKARRALPLGGILVQTGWIPSGSWESVFVIRIPTLTQSENTKRNIASSSRYRLSGSMYLNSYKPYTPVCSWAWVIYPFRVVMFVDTERALISQGLNNVCIYMKSVVFI